MFEFFAKLGSLMHDVYEEPPTRNENGYLKNIGTPLHDEWVYVDTRKRERTVVSVYKEKDRRGKDVYFISAGTKKVSGAIDTEVVYTQFELDRLVDNWTACYKHFGKVKLTNGI